MKTSHLTLFSFSSRNVWGQETKLSFSKGTKLVQKFVEYWFLGNVKCLEDKKESCLKFAEQEAV